MKRKKIYFSGIMGGKLSKLKVNSEGNYTQELWQLISLSSLNYGHNPQLSEQTC